MAKLTMSLSELMKRDDQRKVLEKQEEEKQKLNILRGGNTGVALGDGNYTGECPRKAYMRWKGLFLSAEENRGIMFESGLANETILIGKIEKHLPPGFKILTQSECGTSWEVNGIKVTGSPDIVIADSNNEPHIGIECKQICSLWTGIDVLLKNKVSIKHLAQSAHYMAKLNLPEYKLIYVNYVDFQLPYMKNLDSVLPKKDDPLAEHFEFSPNGKPKKMLPFRKVYELRFGESGFLEYREEGSKSFFTKTIICLEAIEDFFAHVTTLDKDLGPRPLTLTAEGDFATYNICDYCTEVKPICDKFESSPSRWLSEVSKLPTVTDLTKI